MCNWMRAVWYGAWFLSSCVYLSPADVKWLGVSKNCVCLCDKCLNADGFSSDGMLNSILDTVENKLFSVFENTLPKSRKKLVEEKIEPMLASKEENSTSRAVKNLENVDDSLKFTIPRVPEKGCSLKGKIGNELTGIDRFWSIFE